MTGPPGGADPGGVPGPSARPNPANRERTRLAWRRTALAQTVCLLLLLRLAAGHRLSVLGGIVGGLGMLCWLGGMLVTQRRITAMGGGIPVTVGRTLPLTAAGTLALALLGTVLVVLG